MPKVSELATQAPGSGYERVGLVVGASGPDHTEVLDSLRALRSTDDARVRVLFLEASTEVLVRRYESTRRRHPLADGDRLADAIERERVLLDPVKAGADVVIDTSELNVHQLKSRIGDLFGGDPRDHAMQITVESFGFKHGLPLDVDLVLDCRFLPNPHWWTSCARCPASTSRCGSTCSASPRPASSSTTSSACSACCCRRTCTRASRT